MLYVTNTSECVPPCLQRAYLVEFTAREASKPHQISGVHLIFRKLETNKPYLPGMGPQIGANLE